jgi:hypothetical protein
LLLFKSWGEGETSTVLAGESLEGEARVRIYDRFATLVSEETVGATTTITLPPFGFALALWSTAEPLPDLVQAGRQEGPVLELASLFSEGAFVGLDLSPAFNNDAFSDVSDPHKGNFDNHSGVLGATYMAERSPAPGSRFEVEGVPFSFPPTDENANNVAFSNQHLRLPPGQYVRLHLLGASEQGNYQMPVRLHYTDGSSEEVQLGLSDWCQLPRYGETVALEYAQRRTGSGTVDNVACRILAATIDLDDERELAGIDLPDRPTMHIFALTLEKQ